MRFCMAAGSCTGKIRLNNEDRFFFNGVIPDGAYPEGKVLTARSEGNTPVLLGVFDGMGGHEHGEVAASIAAQTVRDRADSLRWEDPDEQLCRLCVIANEEVCRAKAGGNMGTTAVLLLLLNDRYWLCNVGDSPAFLLREGKLETLSREHTQRAVYEKLNGKAEPGKKFPLTQYIGVPDDEMLIEPHICSGSLEDGDVFLLCSDGVTDMLSPEEICELLRWEPSSGSAVEQLLLRSMEAGGKDNITAICVRAGKEEKQTFWQRIRQHFL